MDWYRDNLYLLGSREYKPTYYRKYLTLGLLAAVQDTNTFDDYIDPKLKEQFVDNLISSISVIDQRGTDALKISIKSLDPFEASLICNTLVDIYKKHDLQWVR